MSLVKKISAKTVCGNVKALVKDLETGQKLAIMEVIGLVRPGAAGIQTGETDNGVWTAFKGGFEAINLVTGESYMAGKLFLPDVAQDLILQTVENAEHDVQIHFLIGVREDETSAPGYTYYAEPMMKASESNPLEQIKRESGFGKTAKLTAPAAEKAPEKATVKPDVKKA